MLLLILKYCRIDLSLILMKHSIIFFDFFSLIYVWFFLNFIWMSWIVLSFWLIWLVKILHHYIRITLLIYRFFFFYYFLLLFYFWFLYFFHIGLIFLTFYTILHVFACSITLIVNISFIIISQRRLVFSLRLSYMNVLKQILVSFLSSLPLLSHYLFIILHMK
jgi:hypothetical protein